MKQIIGIISIVLLLTVLASCTDKNAMRERLDYVSQCNRADTVFTEAWLPLVDSLVDYFDHHGNANEKVIAYYLQGRVYSDIGEAPIALECYQKATEMADTTQKECNIHTLAVIYGQMAALYLPDDEMKAIKMAEHYNWKIKDTLAAITAYYLRTGPYFHRNDTDSMLYVTIKSVEMFRQYGANNIAAQVLITPISICIDRGQYAKAWEYMQEHENESGFFDEKGNVLRGKELYYYYKGMYLLSQKNTDTAISLFHKALSGGFIEAGYKGLLSAYEKKVIPDSIAKYSRLFAQANDSSYLNVNQERVHQISSMYNFRRHQRIAEWEKTKAERARLGNIVLALVIATLLGLSTIAYRRYKRKKAMEMNALKVDLSKAIDEYNKLQRQYETLQNANRLSQLEAEEKNHEDGVTLTTTDGYGKLLAEMEGDLASKDAQIHGYEQRLASLLSGKSEEALHASAIVERMRELAIPKKGNPFPSENEWDELAKAVSQHIPSFYKAVVTSKLSTQERRTCILVRLGFTTGEIANLLDAVPPRVAKVKLLANEKLFSVSDARSLYKNLLGM